jgi:hypothetical protein
VSAPPSAAEWAYAIRTLQRRALELEGKGGAAILMRVARHMRAVGPIPALLNRAEWEHVDAVIADALERAKGGR